MGLKHGTQHVSGGAMEDEYVSAALLGENPPGCPGQVWSQGEPGGRNSTSEVIAVVRVRSWKWCVSSWGCRRGGGAAALSLRKSGRVRKTRRLPGGGGGEEWGHLA